MYKFSEMLDTYIEAEVKEIVKRKILNKYRNVFHCDDQFCNKSYDETYLSEGRLDELSCRIKADYSRFECEEVIKITKKVTKLIIKLLQDIKE